MQKVLSSGTAGFVCLLICFWFSVAAAGNGNVPDELKNDPRYEALAAIVREAGFRLAEYSVTKDQAAGSALFVPVLGKDGKEVGFMAIHDHGMWTLSLELSDVIKVYEALLGGDEGALVIEHGGVERGEKESRYRDGERNSTLTIIKVSQTGSNWCQYTSKVGIQFSCVEAKGNPFGYYNVQTYRQGDKITWNHLTWWADYRGRAINCPLNEARWSPFQWVECGFPPD
jgi:hypothetical protein